MADSYMRQNILGFGGQTYSDSLSAACTWLLRQGDNYLKSVKWAAGTIEEPLNGAKTQVTCWSRNDEIIIFHHSL